MSDPRSMRGMRVAHVTPWVGPHAFGPGGVALSLAFEQIRHGLDACVWCTDSSEDISWASRSSGLPREAIPDFGYRGPKLLAYSPAMERAARSGVACSIAVAHQHGIWTATSRVVVILRERL